MSDLISVVKGYSSYNTKNSAVHNPVTTAHKAQFANEDPKAEKRNTKALITGGAVLAAAAATGIYLVMRGRAQKAKQLQEEFQKQFAKFENGKAVANSGKEFSGKITKELKDGSKVVLDYQNGVLKQSSKINGENKVFTKVYEYDKSGKLTKITDGRKYNPTVYLKKYKNKMGFDVIRGTNGAHYTNKETNETLQVVYKGDKSNIKYFKDGKLKYEDTDGVKILYKQDGKTPDITYDGFSYVDENGTKFFNTSHSEGVERLDGSSSSINYHYGVADGRVTSKKVPQRFVKNGTTSSANVPNPDTAYWLSNKYEYRQLDSGGDVLYDFCCTLGKIITTKGVNPKRKIINRISVTPYKKYESHNGFGLFQKDGKIFIEEDKNVIASFNPKTNTFDTLTVPEEQAREIMGWAKKGLEQLKKDRKDYLRHEIKSEKMQEINHYIEDLINCL